MERCNRVQFELTVPDLPDSMINTNKGRSNHDDTHSILSNLDTVLRYFTSSRPAVSTIPEVLYLSPPTSPALFPLNRASPDEHPNPDVTSTVKPTNDAPTDENPSTEGFQIPAANSNENKRKLPSAYFSPNDCRLLLLLPNQFKVALKQKQVYSLAANIAENVLLSKRE